MDGWLHMCDMFCKYGCEQAFLRLEKTDIVALKEKLLHEVQCKWADESRSKPKLNIFRETKSEHFTENYVRVTCLRNKDHSVHRLKEAYCHFILKQAGS